MQCLANIRHFVLPDGAARFVPAPRLGADSCLAAASSMVDPNSLRLSRDLLPSSALPCTLLALIGNLLIHFILTCHYNVIISFYNLLSTIPHPG